MPTPIRELIFQDLKVALQAISGGAEYNNTIPTGNVNIIHGNKEEDAYEEPYIYIYPNPETVSLDRGERGKWFKVLGIGIEVWLRENEKANLGATINEMLYDVEKAVMVDPTRGGNAIETHLVSNTVFINDMASPLCGLIVEIEVYYQNDIFDPAIN